jgi:glyoxylase-like metal-dependent hydrolase (beta-lactamase superfamily II)
LLSCFLHPIRGLIYNSPMIPISEIAPDVYRISVFVPQFNLAFNHFLVKDDEPLLFHAGLRGMFPLLREAVAKLIDPATIRYVGFSHFESDECGGLNEWLALAPQSEAVCGLLGAMVSVNDFANRPAKVLTREETLSTGKHRFRFLPTPHLPHGWDAGLLFEETGKTLFCSDLFVQGGDREPLAADGGFLDRCREDLIAGEGGPFAGATPYTHHTGAILRNLASYRPQTLAVMHGSSYSGDGEQALTGLADVLREVLGSKEA